MSLIALLLAVLPLPPPALVLPAILCLEPLLLADELDLEQDNPPAAAGSRDISEPVLEAAVAALKMSLIFMFLYYNIAF